MYLGYLLLTFLFIKKDSGDILVNEIVIIRIWNEKKKKIDTKVINDNQWLI